jgi:hypothetical protein
MVLLDESLEYFLIDKELIKRNRGDPYPMLDEYRNKLYQMNFESNKSFIEYAYKRHSESLKLLESILKKDISEIKHFLK